MIRSVMPLDDMGQSDVALFTKVATMGEIIVLSW